MPPILTRLHIRILEHLTRVNSPLTADELSDALSINPQTDAMLELYAALDNLHEYDYITDASDENDDWRSYVFNTDKPL